MTTLTDADLALAAYRDDLDGVLDPSIYPEDIMTTRDPRHPRTREVDQLLWERIVGTSPRDEVDFSPADASAEAIAEGLWEFGTNDEHADLDRDATIESLARTLRYEGGAQ